MKTEGMGVDWKTPSASPEIVAAKKAAVSDLSYKYNFIIRRRLTYFS